MRLAGVAVALWLATPSSAAPVTWVFEGRIGAIDGASGATLATLSSLGVTVGSELAGALVFESTSPDSDPRSVRGSYVDSILSFDVTVGSFHAGFELGDPYDQLTVYDGPGSTILALGYGPGESSLFASPIVEMALAALVDGQFGSDALPVIPPALSSLMPFGLGIGGTGYGTGVLLYALDGTLYGELTRLEAVPEPAALALLAPGALALLAARRRYRATRSRAHEIAARCAFRRRASPRPARCAAPPPRSARAGGADRRGS